MEALAQQMAASQAMVHTLQEKIVALEHESARRETVYLQMQQQMVQLSAQIAHVSTDPRCQKLSASTAKP